MSRWIRRARSWQVGCIAAAFSLGAAAQPTPDPLTLDDFSTGPYQHTLKAGEDDNMQLGNMVGGSRMTIYVSCPSTACSGGGVGENPFYQPNSFEIRPRIGDSPSALIFNSGYKTYPNVSLKYGYGKPIKLDLSPYDRIRINFDGANEDINLNVLMYSNSGSVVSSLGCGVKHADNLNPFIAEFPFTKFSRPEVFKGVTNMIFEFGASQGTNMQADYAVTSIQAVDGSDPTAFVCNPKPAPGATQ